MVLDLIQKPLGTLDILLFLSRNARSDVTSIMEGAGTCTSTFYSAVNRLKSLGLVFEETEVGWPTRVYYQLTDKGEEVVGHLQSLERIISTSIDAQRTELERLKSKETSQKDKERMLELLSNLQEANYDLEHWDETLRLSETAIELATELQDDHHFSHAYRYAGAIHQKRSEVSKAIECLNQSIQASNRIKDWRGLAEAHYTLGATYEVTGDLEGAHSFYKKSHEFAQKAEWNIGKALARMGYGRVLGRRDRIQESVKELKKAVDEFERLKDLKHLAHAYSNLGATMLYVDEEGALECIEKSVDIARRTGRARTLATGLVNSSNIHLRRKEFEKALRYLKEAEGIYDELGMKRMLASVCINRGSAYALQERWKESEECYKKGVILSEETDDKYNLADALNHYGQMLIDKGDSDKAEVALRRALSIFRELGSENKIAGIEKNLRSVDH